MALAALLLLMAYNWAAGIWLDLVDEGYFLELASRIMRGALPYRDFDTYYTPAVFYLHALTFWLSGEQSVLPVRLVLAVVRTTGLVVLYLLARRIAPPPLALLPALIVFVVDPVPIMWEPHPGTYAYLAMLGTVWWLTEHLDVHRHRSLLLAGVAAGVAFAFKQNIGVFALLAAGAFLVLHERPSRAPWPVDLARFGLVAVLCLSFARLIWSGLNVLYAVVFLAPLVVVCAVLFWDGRRGGPACPWPDVLRHWALLGGGFALVTLLWLVPLVAALGWENVPFELFVGRVNKAPLVYPLELPTPAMRPVLLLLAIPLLGWVWSSFDKLRTGSFDKSSPGSLARLAILPTMAFALLVVLAVVLPTAPMSPMPAEAVTSPEAEFVDWLYQNAGNVLLYLPTLIFWPALAALIWRTLQDGPASAPRWRWYLFVGVIMMFAQYPRVDEIHLLHAGPPIMLAGCGLLIEVWRALAKRPIERWMWMGSAILLIGLAVAPSVGWRIVTLTTPDSGKPRVLDYESLGLARARVLGPGYFVGSVRAVVQYLGERTAPGEPIFVYPVAPMFYFLADRPNPTRYNHVHAGVAPPDEQEVIIQQLAEVRYVIWDHTGVEYWQTHPANRTLTDHLWSCYAPIVDFAPYVILERTSRPGC